MCIDHIQALNMAEQDQKDTGTHLAISSIIQRNNNTHVRQQVAQISKSGGMTINPTPTLNNKCMHSVQVPDMSSHSQSMLWLVLVEI